MARANLKKRDGKTILLQTWVNEETGRPLVIAAEQNYDTLSDLVAAHPELGTAEKLLLYCELCLHFYPGPGCMLIEDQDEFRTRYEALLRHGMENPDDMPSAADFGPFDVSEIGQPQLLKDMLVFYAEDMLYSVPYRVEAPWPHREKEQVKFLLLPLQE